MTEEELKVEIRYIKEAIQRIEEKMDCFVTNKELTAFKENIEVSIEPIKKTYSTVTVLVITAIVVAVLGLIIGR